jgi:hypothetical protein
LLLGASGVVLGAGACGAMVCGSVAVAMFNEACESERRRTSSR